MKDRKLRIAFSPLTSDNNKYIGITVDSLRRAGADVYEFYPIFKNPKLFFRTDIIILNWFERLGNSTGKRLAKFAAKILILAVLRLAGKKIMYVFHNQVSHEESDKKLSWFFIKYLCRRVDRVIILSGGSRDVLKEYLSPKQIEKKVRLIPHPNYIGSYAARDNPVRPIEGRPTLLFMGAIRPYKNIELILSAAKEFRDRNVRFIIAGRPFNEEYRKTIEDSARKLDNVELKLRFIDDAAIADLVQSADALILPYDLRNSLNSGTVILAFSYARTVICPEIATLRDFPDNLVYGYEYASDPEHESKLFAAIDRFISDYAADGAALRQKGLDLRAEVERNNSPESIDRRYAALLDEFK